MDRRLGLKWYRLADRTGVSRVITPIAEAPGEGIPGIVRYRDGHGRIGFTEQLWMRDNATALHADDVAALLPLLSEHEIDRLFPQPQVKPAPPKASKPTTAPLRANGNGKPRRAKSERKPAPVEIKVLHRKVPRAPLPVGQG